MSKNVADSARILITSILLICLLGLLNACNEEETNEPTQSESGPPAGGGGSGGTGSGGTGSGGTGSGGGGQENLGSLTGSIDATLLTESYCSTNSSANAVYIYRGNTVIAVDISGSNTDPVLVVQATQNQGTISYEGTLSEGIYTIAFTCQADQDQPSVAGDAVNFRGVTNVEIVTDQETVHNFVVGSTSSGGLNKTIQAMPANSWLEVPNSHLSQVEAKDPETDDIWQGNYQGADGLFAWSGGAFDTKRNNLIIWGGGHHDYYGNEIYTFNLTNFQWVRVTEPSLPVTSPNVCRPILDDGTPNSRHTYYNLEYIPTLDKFYSTPAGSTSCDSGGVDPNTWTFDFTSKEWTNMNSTGTPVEGWAPTAAAYDPIEDKVYAHNPDGLFVHDIQSNEWSHLNRFAYWDDYGAAVDTKRHLLVFVGGGKVVVYDIGNKDYTPQVWDDYWAEPPIATSEGSEFIHRWYRPGVNYDPVADKIVVWDDGQVHALDLDTKTWSHLSTAPQAHWYKGTYGRFRYSPIENAYVLVNSANQNVLIFKLTEGGGK